MHSTAYTDKNNAVYVQIAILSLILYLQFYFMLYPKSVKFTLHFSTFDTFNYIESALRCRKFIEIQ